ncbi:MAG: BatA domain-containing protein [Planctomycetota bacterium]|nr:BatA domain-containing protein [Planctomycetota bacterium]
MPAGLTFLDPLAGVLAAGIALPLLVVMYLLKLRRRPARVTASFLWRQALRDEQVNVPLRWVPLSLLFLLHVVIVLLIAGAIARPALPDVGLSGGRWILLIDRSASMSARDQTEGRSRLEVALERAREQGGTLSGASAAVVAFAAEPRILTGFTDSRAAVASALASVTPTDQPADLRAMTRLIESLTVAQAGSEDDTEPVQVVLFTDANYRAEDLVRAGSLGNAVLRVERVGPGPDSASDNAGFVALAARRDFEQPARVRVFFRLVNASGREESALVRVTLDGAEVARRPVRIAARASATEPGEASDAFTISAPGSGLLELALVRPDVLSADDRAALWLPAPARPAITLVRPSGAVMQGEAPASEFLIRDILEELRPLSLRVMSPAQWLAARADAATRGDLVVHDGAAPDTPDPIPSLIFSRTSGTLRGARLIASDETSRVRSPLSWARSHPLLRDLTLDTLVFRGYARVETVAGARVTDLLTIEEGTIAALVEPADGPRSIAVGLSLADSNWATQPSLAIFLARAVDLLGSGTGSLDERSSVAFGAGQAIEVAPPAGRLSQSPPLRMRAELSTAPGVDGAREFAELVSGPSGERVSLGVAERAGVYRAEGVPPVAVNAMDELESGLTSVSEVRLGGRTAAGAGEPTRREVWVWCVLAAAALLILEWFLLAARSRIRTPPAASEAPGTPV